MKTIIRIPTVQYGYIEQEVDTTPEGAVEAHNELLTLYTGGFGITPKEFNTALDRYLTDGTGVTEVYVRMSKEQRQVFQEIKKSFKRMEAKNN